MATESRDGGALRDRFDELAERVRELDLRGRIAANPWPVVGAAALLGAWFAFAPRREPRVAPRRGPGSPTSRLRRCPRLRCGWRATPRSARPRDRVLLVETTSPPSDVEAAAEPYHH